MGKGTNFHPRAPRQHAAEILKMKDKADRVRYLAKEVPEKYRDMVKEYVVDAYARGRK